MSISFERALNGHDKALGFRAQRAEVLANNMANADTPNYKARDFDFASALQSAVAGRSDGDLALSKTSTRHLDGGAGSGPARLMYRVPTQGAVDGNTVEMDVERSAFAENAVHYEAGLSFITARIKTMMAAIQGQ